MIGTKNVCRDRVADYLQRNSRFGPFTNHVPFKRRYVDLQKNGMFEALKSLYKQILFSAWDKFKQVVQIQIQIHNIPAGTDTDRQQNFADYAAAVYVSAWFHDLYVANRNASRKFWEYGYHEIYSYDAVFKLYEYDSFLARLNECIRPTIVKYSHEDLYDTLFIPRISSNLHLDDPRQNYFGITGYEVNDELLRCIVHIMKDRNIVRMVPLPESPKGHPIWLFDWHDDGRCYAWFPAEANYIASDVAVAYIMGVACSPNLGPCDRDEWQDFIGNIVPEELCGLACPDRVSPNTYYGAFMYIVFETRTCCQPDQAISEEINLGIVVPAPNQFRIVDFMYNACVIERMEKQTLLDAFCMFVKFQN